MQKGVQWKYFWEPYIVCQRNTHSSRAAVGYCSLQIIQTESASGSLLLKNQLTKALKGISGVFPEAVLTSKCCPGSMGGRDSQRSNRIYQGFKLMLKEGRKDFVLLWFFSVNHGQKDIPSCLAEWEVKEMVLATLQRRRNPFTNSPTALQMFPRINQERLLSAWLALLPCLHGRW